MNRERVMADAKRDALAGGRGLPAARAARSRCRWAARTRSPRSAWASTWPSARARISEHDARIGALIARVLTGGDVPHRTTVSERQLLDLEREAFLSCAANRRRSSGSAIR